jgi:hypothetical protein
MVSYILIFKFLEWRQEDKTLNKVVGSIPRNLSRPNFFVNEILVCYSCSLKLKLCHTFEGVIRNQ